ncbi:hypothetical protein [Flavobacterium sp.]|uniref:hypothetical protein n=1 Tax=Flavobacterium sp. TaxID=239 RepID=UPI0035B28BF3
MNILIKDQKDIEQLKTLSDDEFYIFCSEEFDSIIKGLLISEIKDSIIIFKFNLGNKIKEINDSLSLAMNNNEERIIKGLKSLKDNLFDNFQRKYPDEIKWYKQPLMFNYFKQTDGNFPIYPLGFNNDKKKRFFDSNTLKTENNKNNLANKPWFKIGVDFANGKIFELISEGCNYSQVSRQLYGSDKYKNYISESFSTNPSNKSKAILQNKVKMSLIKEYFDKNNKNVNEKFIEYFNKLK